MEDAAIIARNVLAAMEYDVYPKSAAIMQGSNGIVAEVSRKPSQLTEATCPPGTVNPFEAAYPLELLDDQTRLMLEGMTQICAREDTLYSWKNTLVAVADAADTLASGSGMPNASVPGSGMPDGSGLGSGASDSVVMKGPMIVGSLTSYDGAEYLAIRELTFGLAREKFGWQPPVMDDETQAGEWYLDSLAVHPSFRKRGIAQLLVRETFELASALGFHQASLIALASAPRLRAFYEALGFRPDRHLNCFGHDYLRMLTDI